MTVTGTRESMALRAAHLYYLQDVTMEAIARELSVSRSTVSRLLKWSRDTGIVEIKLRPPSDRSDRLATELTRIYGINAIVTPATERLPDSERLERVAREAAGFVSVLVDSDSVLALAWGTTTSAISRHLPLSETQGVQIVQLNGAANTTTTGIEYTGEIIARFGVAFDATIHQFLVPAFFDRAATKSELWRERSVGRIVELQQRAAVALFSIGSVSAETPSHVYTAGYLDDADMASLHADGVVGDVGTVFFREDGSADNIALNERASGPDFEALRRIPRRVCAVTGLLKVAGIRGALRAGLITDLIIDEVTARKLLSP